MSYVKKVSAVMGNYSTNIKKIAAHLNSLNPKKTTKYDVGNPRPGLGQAQQCGRVKPVDVIPSLLS